MRWRWKSIGMRWCRSFRVIRFAFQNQFGMFNLYISSGNLMVPPHLSVCLSSWPFSIRRSAVGNQFGMLMALKWQCFSSLRGTSCNGSISRHDDVVIIVITYNQF